MALRYIRGRFRARPAKVAQNVLGIEENFDQLAAVVTNPNSSVSQRVSAAAMIQSSIDQNSISSIPEVWYSVMQLLELTNQTELRRAGWKLVNSCIQHDEVNAGNYNNYYHAIIDYCNVEDFDLVLRALETLTDGGRKIINAATANYRIPQVLASWTNLLALRTQELEMNPSAKDITEQWGQSTPENFLHLLQFTANVLKFNMTCFDDRDIERQLLINAAVIKISQNQKVMAVSCNLISIIMAFGHIPLAVLPPVIQVLCTVSLVSDELDDLAWACIVNLTKSHLYHSTVQRLCKIVESHDLDVSYTMRVAATKFLCRVIVEQANDEEELPSEGLPLVEVLSTWSSALDHSNIDLNVAIVDSIAEFLRNDKVRTLITFDIWQSSTLSPLTLVWKLGDYLSANIKTQNSLPSTSQLEKYQLGDNAAKMRSVAVLLGEVVGSLLKYLASRDSVIPLEETIAITSSLSPYISSDSALDFVNLLDSLHLCSPYMEEWQSKVNMLLNKVYRLPNFDAKVYKAVVHVCQPLLMLPEDDEEVQFIVNKLFSHLEAKDPSVLDSLLEVYRELALYGSWVLFEQATISLVKLFPDQSADMAPSGESEKLTKVANAMVDSFLALFQSNARKSSLLYGTLIKVCKLSICDPKPFQVAFSLLCRLRANAKFCISVTEPSIERDYGEALCNFQVQLAMKKKLVDTPSIVLHRASKDEDSGPSTGPSQGNGPKNTINPSLLLSLMENVLQSNAPESVYCQVLVNGSTLLSNMQLFSGYDGELVNFRNFLFRQCGAVRREKFATSKQEIVSVYIHMLTLMMGYSNIFTKQDYDKLLQTLLQVINEWDKTTANWTIHCLVICCYECPANLQRFLPQILARLQTRITSKDSSTHILEFLLTLSLVDVLTSSFNLQEFKRVFGICFSYIQNARDSLSKSSDMNAAILSQYLQRLAHFTISYLFLAIDLADREQVVSYLVRNFALSSKVKGDLDPTNLCTYDLLCRYTYSDQPLGLTSRATELNRYPKDRENSNIWLMGSSLVEITTNKQTGKSFIIARRPTCTLVTTIKPIEGSLISISDRYSQDEIEETSVDILAADKNLQFLPPFWIEMLMQGLNEGGPRPIPVTPSAPHLRAISSLDRAPVVDFHKVGVIYIGQRQDKEHEILANTCGSQSYRKFLTGLGQFVRLKGNREIYAGGLDTENNIDGEYTVAWVGKIAQITFHVITMMPNPEHDPSLSSKKRHIGNNYVNIYFDESGREFNFDVVKSQFNFINIVISPTYYKGKFKVCAYRKPGLANVLAAYESKVVDEAHLALFVRHLTIKASIYAKVYNQSGDYTDQWLHRLELINNLRSRVLAERAEESENGEKESMSSQQEGGPPPSGPPQQPEEEVPEYLSNLLSRLDFTQNS